MRSILIKELNRIITLLVSKEYEELTNEIDCQGLSSNDILNIIEDFGETLVVPKLEQLEELNIIDIDENEWAIDFDLWTQESGKSDLTIQLTIKRNSDKSLDIKLDDIHIIDEYAQMFKDHGYSAAADILEVLCRISVAQLSLPIVLSLFETVARCI